MPRTTYAELRPGHLIPQPDGYVRRVTQVTWKEGSGGPELYVTTAGDGRSREDRAAATEEVEVAHALPKADMRWDTARQRWALTVQTMEGPHGVDGVDVEVDGATWRPALGADPETSLDLAVRYARQLWEGTGQALVGQGQLGYGEALVHLLTLLNGDDPEDPEATALLRALVNGDAEPQAAARG